MSRRVCPALRLRWFALPLACIATLVLAQADAPEMEEAPPLWKPTPSMSVVENGPVPYPAYSELTNELELRFRYLSYWINGSKRKTKELREDVDTLEDEVEALKRQLANLQQPAPQPPPPGASADTARIAALEKRVAQLESERGKFVAPFTITGTGGRPLLRVSPNGAFLFGGGQAQIVLAVPANGDPLMAIKGAGSTVDVRAGNDGGVVRAVSSVGTARLESGAQTVGVNVATGGKPGASLGMQSGGAIALRIMDAGGKTIVGAGPNPKAAGTGLVYVGDGSRNAAALAVDSGGGGLVHAFAADGSVGSGLSGRERLVAAYNRSGAAVVSMGKSENSEGGNVTARSPSGEGVFRAGYATGGGGGACVINAKRGTNVCLGVGVPGVGGR